MARDVRLFSSTAQAAPTKAAPESILIIGAGVFGLSTIAHLLTLPRYARTTITLLDTHLPSLEPTSDGQSCQEHQNPHAASIDSSRIVRPDYANPAYTRLAVAAQERWRRGYGDCLSCGMEGSVYAGIQGTGEILKCEDKTCRHDPVYKESGLILTGDASGSEYVSKAYKNARDLGLDVAALNSTTAIATAFESRGKGKASREAIELRIGGAREDHKEGRGQGKRVDMDAGYGLESWKKREALGETGYINRSSGCVDNRRAMANFMSLVISTARQRNASPSQARVTFVRGKASHLLFSLSFPTRVVGAAIQDADLPIHASLTIVAAGAHSPSLVDLRGRAEARAQVMTYVPVTPAEASALKDMPVLLNIGTGMFAIPPVLTPLPPTTPTSARRKEWTIKIARHAYGYANPTPVTIHTSYNQTQVIETSVPAQQYSPIPAAAEKACRAFLWATLPALGDRAFAATRLCWYTDTPVGDFLVDHHPSHPGLFLATGGSGHAFKFLPVLGGKVVDAVEGRLEEDLHDLWRWPARAVEPFCGTEDGSRSGERGAVLGDEWVAGKARL